MVFDIKNNIIYESTSDGAFAGDPDNLPAENPLLVDYQLDNEDYSLLSDSPAIDQATDFQTDGTPQDLGAFGYQTSGYVEIDSTPPNIHVIYPLYGAVISNIAGNGVLAGSTSDDGKLYFKWRIDDIGNSGFQKAYVRIENSWTNYASENDGWIGPFYDGTPPPIAIPISSLPEGITTIRIKAWDHIGNVAELVHEGETLPGHRIIKKEFERSGALVCPIGIEGTASSIEAPITRVDLCFNSNEYQEIDENGEYTQEGWGWINVLMTDIQIEEENGLIPASQKYISYVGERSGWFKMFSYPKVDSSFDSMKIGVEQSYVWAIRAPLLQDGGIYEFKIDIEGLFKPTQTKIEIWNVRKRKWELLGLIETEIRAEEIVSFAMNSQYRYEQQGIRIKVTFTPHDEGSCQLYSFKLEGRDLDYSTWYAYYYADLNPPVPPGYTPLASGDQNYRIYENRNILSRAVDRADLTESDFSIQNRNLIVSDVAVDVTAPSIKSVTFVPDKLEYSRDNLEIKIQFNETMRPEAEVRVDLLPSGLDENNEGNYIPFYGGRYTTTEKSNDTYIISNVEDITSLTGNGIAKLRLQFAQDRARNEIIPVLPNGSPSYGMEINIPKRYWSAKLVGKNREEKEIESYFKEEMLDIAVDPLTQGLIIATENGFGVLYDIDDYPASYTEQEIITGV